MAPVKFAARLQERTFCETQLPSVIQDLTSSVGSSPNSRHHSRLQQRLLHKLTISGEILSWINNCLSSRQQSVFIDGTASRKADIISGVLQSTVLGPLLFLVYIYDLPNNLKFTARLFPNDCILYRVAKNIRDCIILQEDLPALTNKMGKDTADAIQRKEMLRHVYYPQKCLLSLTTA